MESDGLLPQEGEEEGTLTSLQQSLILFQKLHQLLFHHSWNLCSNLPKMNTQRRTLKMRRLLGIKPLVSLSLLAFLSARVADASNKGKRKYKEAVQHYTTAIDLDTQNHIYYSNRSMAYLRLGEHAKALEDAEKVVAINPTWAKGYFRKGSAFLGIPDLLCLCFLLFYPSLTYVRSFEAVQGGRGSVLEGS